MVGETRGEGESASPDTNDVVCLGMTVFTFEPQPMAIEKAMQNIRNAGLESKTTYIDVVPGQVSM